MATNDPTETATTKRPRATAARIEELETELAAAKALLAESSENAKAWRDSRMSDPEAQAISIAARAISAMLEADRASSPGSSWERQQLKATSAERVVRYLALRFGVEWPTPALPETLTVVAQEDIRQHETCEVGTRDGTVRRSCSPMFG